MKGENIVHAIVFFLLPFLTTSITVLKGEVSKRNQEIYIIIPGTWATKKPWHQTGSQFYHSLQQSAARLNRRVATFNWSGELGHSARQTAGERLANVIEMAGSTSVVHLVTHSHGTNVGIIASHLLEKNKSSKKIHTFYALATPVDQVRYLPNMNVIDYFYNFYSLTDMIQPVLGMYQRVYPPLKNVVNVRTMINFFPPDHFQIHNQLIGRWIPFIHENLAQKKLGNFDKFSFEKSALINFRSNGFPIYKHDHAHRALLEQDTQQQEEYAQLFFTKKQSSDNQERERDMLIHMLDQESKENITQLLGQTAWKKETTEQ